MWHSMWEWYGGQSEGFAVDGEQSALLQELRSDSEATSQAAAYALGRAGEPAVGSLMDCLRQGSEHVRRKRRLRFGRSRPGRSRGASPSLRGRGSGRAASCRR